MQPSLVMTETTGEAAAAARRGKITVVLIVVDSQAEISTKDKAGRVENVYYRDKIQPYS